MILVVDHYDSFTYNLVQLLESLGDDDEVVKSDAEPAEALVARSPTRVIAVAGPGHARGAGCFTELLRLLPDATPVLGVCLGHQAMGIAYGGRSMRAEPVHGKASPCDHDGGRSSRAPIPFEAGRYHSLVVTREGFPDELELTAWSDDDPRDGGPPSVAAGRGPVPPGVDPDARRPHDRPELPRAARVADRPVHAESRSLPLRPGSDPSSSFAQPPNFGRTSPPGICTSPFGTSGATTSTAAAGSPSMAAAEGPP